MLMLNVKIIIYKYHLSCSIRLHFLAEVRSDCIRQQTHRWLPSLSGSLLPPND